MIGKIIIQEALFLLLMNVNLTAREIQRVAFLYVHTLSVHYSNKYDFLSNAESVISHYHLYSSLCLSPKNTHA